MSILLSKKLRHFTEASIVECALYDRFTGISKPLASILYPTLYSESGLEIAALNRLLRKLLHLVRHRILACFTEVQTDQKGGATAIDDQAASLRFRPRCFYSVFDSQFCHLTRPFVKKGHVNENVNLPLKTFFEVILGFRLKKMFYPKLTSMLTFGVQTLDFMGFLIFKNTKIMSTKCQLRCQRTCN